MRTINSYSLILFTLLREYPYNTKILLQFAAFMSIIYVHTNFQFFILTIYNIRSEYSIDYKRAMNNEIK